MRIVPGLAKHRFTVDDYHRMGDTGVLKPDARVELIEGEIIDMAPIGPFHGGSTNRLTELFSSLAKGRWLVSVQNSLRIDEYSEPQPDLMLLKRRHDFYTTRLPRPDDVFLLIEVADTTLAFDRNQKLPVYARAGVVEVWILNLAEGKLELYREPSFSGYGSAIELRPGDHARPACFPDVSVEVAELVRKD